MYIALSILAGFLTYIIFQQLGYINLLSSIWQLNAQTIVILQSNLVDDEKQKSILRNSKKLFIASFKAFIASVFVFLPSIAFYYFYQLQFRENTFLFFIGLANVVGMGMGVFILKKKNEK